MNADPSRKNQDLITLSDIWLLLKKSKKTIIFSTIVMAVIGAIFAFTRPIEYTVEGTFREKSPTPSSIDNSLLNRFSVAVVNLESENVMMLRSRQFLLPIIERLHLQATIEKKEQRNTYYGLIKENALVEFAHFSNTFYPVLDDIEHSVKVIDISYIRETPSFFNIVFSLDKKDYDVFDQNNMLVGHGMVDMPITIGDIKFTISNGLSDTNLANSSYFLSLWPIAVRSAEINKKLNIESDKNDVNFLKISYKHRDRHLASTVVNTIMEHYQNYLRQIHHQQAALQLEYLNKKQEASDVQLRQVFSDYANSLSKDVSSTGFADSEKEMEFLVKCQHDLKERLITNELETKRLQSLQEGKCIYYASQAPHETHSIVINHVLEEMRDLKQQRDSLELALRKNSLSNTADLHEAFLQQLQELSDVSSDLAELEELQSGYHSHQTPNKQLRLFNDSRFLIKSWYEKIEQSQKTTNIDNSSKLNQESDQFLLYLKNLNRLFHVQEKIVKERLTHQQNPSLEFQGINLTTANELYLQYSKQLHDIESKIKENAFLIKDMQNTEFELSSLSIVVSDYIGIEMVKKAGQLAHELQDQKNLSSREQERLKDELALQKNLLLVHLEQINQILELNQSLVHEKIYLLQNVILELIHQRISVLEKNLNDYISTKLINMQQERLINEQRMSELHQEMSLLPRRWAAEKLMKQQLEINELIVKEVAKLVESKNIAHKLELMQSTPIDQAIPPIHPKSNHLILFSTLGALLGLLFSSGIALRKHHP